MSWFALALIAATAFSAYSIFIRRFLDGHGDAQIFALLSDLLLALLLLGVFAPVSGIWADLSLDEGMLIIAASGLYAGSSMLMIWGRQLEEASRVSVARETTAVWVFAGGILLLGEGLSLLKVLGVLLILSGTLLATRDEDGFRPSKGMAMVLGGSLLAGGSSLIGKTIVEDDLAPALYVGVVALLAASWLSIFLPDVRRRAREEITLQGLHIPVIALTLGLSVFLLYTAFQRGEASRVRPVYGMATVMTVILAIFLLGERDRMVQKLAGAAVVVGGVLAIGLL